MPFKMVILGLKLFILPDKAAFRQQDYDAAIASFTLAIRAKHDSWEIYNDRGSAYRMAERYNEAIEDYKKAISLNTSSPIIYNNYGSALRKKEHLMLLY